MRRWAAFSIISLVLASAGLAQDARLKELTSGVDANAWEAVGRLAPGASLEHARVETSNILNENFEWAEVRAIILSRTEDEVRGIGSPLLLLLAATGLLLLRRWRPGPQSGPVAGASSANF